jgi:hypothetical protein
VCRPEVGHFRSSRSGDNGEAWHRSGGAGGVAAARVIGLGAGVVTCRGARSAWDAAFPRGLVLVTGFDGSVAAGQDRVVDLTSRAGLVFAAGSACRAPLQVPCLNCTAL